MSDNIISDVNINNICVNNTNNATDYLVNKKIKKRKNKCNFFIIRDGKKIFCKEKTTLMGNDCKWCTLRYCFKHTLPEAHNCINISECHKTKKCMQNETTLNGKTITPKIEII